jgi:glycosyltransferase involved in cell wall biosynthesis
LIERLTTPRPMADPVVPRVAFVSPMPPAPTGIATYAAAVLEGLERSGYRRRRQLDVIWPVKPKHDLAIVRYRLGVYHIGNNVEFHGDVYRLASLRDGVVVLHDLGLDDLVRGLVDRGDPLGYRAAREALVGADRLTLAEARDNEPLSWPWCAHIARIAKSVIVHSAFCKRYLEDLGCRTPVFVVPHPPVEREIDLRRAAQHAPSIRARLGLREGDVLVVAAGDLNPAKQLEALVAAAARLDERVHLALVGRRIPTFDPDALVRASRLGSRVTLATDVSEGAFRAWLCAADVVADLRFPHRGEVSGTLMRAMQVGRPTLVTATGTYLDLPEDAVVRIAPGRADPQEVADVLTGLADRPDARNRIGAAARRHVETTASLGQTAGGYEEAIEFALRLVQDPRRLALTRWALALNDLGITPEGLDEDYGLSYVRALAEIEAHAGPSRSGTAGDSTPTS